VFRDSPVRRLICRIDAPCRANILISTACSWVNIRTAQKAAILTQGGHFYFGAGGQFYVGGDNEALQGEWDGHRSSRLNLQYRVIYRGVRDEVFVKVVDVTAHDYPRK
jgi:hypothetical protein